MVAALADLKFGVYDSYPIFVVDVMSALLALTWLTLSVAVVLI